MIIAEETASANTQEEISGICVHIMKCRCILFGDKEQLGRAIGKEYRSCLAVHVKRILQKNIAALLAEA